MLKLLVFLPCAVLPFVAVASDEEASNSGVYVQVAAQTVAGIHRSQSVQVYAEKPVNDTDFSVFGFGYASRDDFRALYVGPAWKNGNLQIGLGFGEARYDDISHPTVSPWVSYVGEKVEVFAAADRYSRESDPASRWFYKGWAHYAISDGLSIGVYREKGVGSGPMISWKADDHVKLWASVPVIKRAEGARFVLGFVVEF